MFIEEKDADGKTMPNYKAAGICYNNIGSIQYQQANYNHAKQNFKLAKKVIKKYLQDEAD